MQLTCPNCGEPIPAGQINIQQMSAVCSACDNIFQFEMPKTKIKRRKVKQPSAMTVQEVDSGLNFAFRTNFRLDRNEGFMVNLILGGLLTMMSFALVGELQTGSIPPIVPLIVGIGALVNYYGLALNLYNKTHIEIDDSEIRVSRKPLPSLSNHPSVISLSGIRDIHYEETPISIKEAYDTPRYNLWAEMVDGSKKIIVKDLVEDYAIFIAQRLNEQLLHETDEPLSVSRLLDQASQDDDHHFADDSAQVSMRK